MHKTRTLVSFLENLACTGIIINLSILFKKMTKNLIPEQEMTHRESNICAKSINAYDATLGP